MNAISSDRSKAIALEVRARRGADNSTPETKTRQFASDNYAGICPEVLHVMEIANHGHQPAYGEDQWTARAADAFRDLFETPCEVFFAFNGTAANSMALASLCSSYQSIICADVAHVETDECGAPEFFSNGSKLLLAASRGGKMTPDAIRTVATARADIHYPRPRAVTITQPTETGRVYSIAEVRAISATCKELGLKLHMDGARFSNACASLGCSPADITWKAGVDVLCFGGTKAGMAFGEAVVFFDTSLATDFDYRCKQAGQLASKMRFLSAPWVALLQDGAWLRNAAHANASARRFAALIADVPQVELLYPVEANAVFLAMPQDVTQAMRDKGWRFYQFIGGGARFMFAWDADVETIVELADDLRASITIAA